MTGWSVEKWRILPNVTFNLYSFLASAGRTGKDDKRATVSD